MPERRVVIQRAYRHYQKADRAKKVRILDEIVEWTLHTRAYPALVLRPGADLSTLLAPRSCRNSRGGRLPPWERSTGLEGTIFDSRPARRDRRHAGGDRAGPERELREDDRGWGCAMKCATDFPHSRDTSGILTESSKFLQCNPGYIRDRYGNNSNVFPSWSREFDSPRSLLKRPVFTGLFNALLFRIRGDVQRESRRRGLHTGTLQSRDLRSRVFSKDIFDGLGILSAHVRRHFTDFLGR